jgi:hypothetical protein
VVGRLRDARVFVSSLVLAAIAYAAGGRSVDDLCDTHLRVAYAAGLQRTAQPLASWPALVAIALPLVGWALSITVT